LDHWFFRIEFAFERRGFLHNRHRIDCAVVVVGFFFLFGGVTGPLDRALAHSGRRVRVFLQAW
jgi:hypothetical protein